VYDVFRKLQPIGIRKRVSRKICPFGGDYLTDVDEGIQEEVRIFNEELNVPTNASCEGHLPVQELNAYILGIISSNQRKLIHRHMEGIGKYCNMEDSVKEYVFNEKDYKLIFSFFDRCLKNYGNRFKINIRSKKTVKIQSRWDNMRKIGFKNTIDILKKTF